MANDFKNILERNMESYIARAIEHIGWMHRDIETLETIVNDLIENPDWNVLLEALNYLEIIQHSNNKCNDLINRAMENNEIRRRYTIRCENDE